MNSRKQLLQHFKLCSLFNISVFKSNIMTPSIAKMCIRQKDTGFVNSFFLLLLLRGKHGCWNYVCVNARVRLLQVWALKGVSKSDSSDSETSIVLEPLINA